jgi:hypothetical protein
MRRMVESTKNPSVVSAPKRKRRGYCFHSMKEKCRRVYPRARVRSTRKQGNIRRLRLCVKRARPEGLIPLKKTESCQSPTNAVYAIQIIKKCTIAKAEIFQIL